MGRVIIGVGGACCPCPTGPAGRWVAVRVGGQCRVARVPVQAPWARGRGVWWFPGSTGPPGKRCGRFTLPRGVPRTGGAVAARVTVGAGGWEAAAWAGLALGWNLGASTRRLAGKLHPAGQRCESPGRSCVDLLHGLEHEPRTTVHLVSTGGVNAGPGWPGGPAAPAAGGGGPRAEGRLPRGGASGRQGRRINCQHRPRGPESANTRRLRRACGRGVRRGDGGGGCCRADVGRRPRTASRDGRASRHRRLGPHPVGI